MSVVRLDGLDHEIEFVGTVDLPGDAIVLVWRDHAGFGEVVQAVNPSGRVVSHNEHHTAFAFRPREQEEMIGAEVEHGVERSVGREQCSRAHGQLRCGVSRPAPRRGLSSQRGACLLPDSLFGRRRIGIAIAFAEAVAAEQKDFGILHQTIGDGRRDGGVVEDVAPVGEGRV